MAKWKMHQSGGGLIMSEKFPKIKKSIQDFFNDEDGSITRNKVLMIGGMALVLGIILGDEIFAAHRTHYTHRTHSSHRTSNSKHGSHSSHYTSHSTHSNHYTHGSHSSHASHVSYTTSANYGSTTTSDGGSWPSLSNIQSIETPVIESVAIDALPEISTVISDTNTPIDTAPVNVTEVNTIIKTPPETPQFVKITKE